MTKVTAVGTVNKVPLTDGVQTALHFYPAYDNPANKEWAKWTPAMSIQMNVLNEVADKFERGTEYLITFEEKGE